MDELNLHILSDIIKQSDSIICHRLTEICPNLVLDLFKFTPNDMLSDACKLPYEPLEYELSLDWGADDLKSAFISACDNSRLWAVKLLIALDKICRDTEILRYTFRSGDENIIKFIYDKYTTNTSIIFENGLFGLAEGGYHELFEEYSYIWKSMDDAQKFLHALYGACLGGHMDTLNYVLTQWLNKLHIEEYYVKRFLDESMHYACKGNHKHIVDELIKRDITSFNMGLMGACNGGHLEMIDYMLDKGADNIDIGYRGACFGDNVEAFDKLYKISPPDEDMIFEIQQIFFRPLKICKRLAELQ